MNQRFEHRLLVDGELVESTPGGTYENIDPSDGSVLGLAIDAQPEDVARAVGAARRAFDTTEWSADHPFRHHCLRQLQAALRESAEELRTIQIEEAGQVLSTATATTSGVIENMSFMTQLATSYEYERSYGLAEIRGVSQDRRVRREPYGVAALISPWNAPFLTNIWKLTPALAAGNTCVLKAAPATPYSATTIGRIIAEHTDIPSGVVNIITSADKAIVGEALTGDPRVDVFHFTGSPLVGQRIMERAAQGLRHVALELGGKSANIVLDDADLDATLPFSAAMACTLSGQGCALPTRILLPDSLFDEAVDRLRAMFEQFPIGDPHLAETVIGPIISQPQLDRILGLVNAGLTEGARLVTGGKPPKMDGRLANGTWMEPTLFVDVDPHSTIAQTEIFGPVLSVIRYSNDDDAVRIANCTPYGLSGFIQSADPERALRLARLLRTGSVGLNGTAPWASPDVPFGGTGISGLGREHGVEGFEEYLQTKTISIPR